jgi:hypothetical protein
VVAQGKTEEIGGGQKAIEDQMRLIMAEIVDMKARVASEIKQSVSDEVARASSRSVLDIQAALLPLNTMVAAAAPLSPPTSITIPQPQSPSSSVLGDSSEPALGPLSGSDTTPTSKGVGSSTGAPATTQQEAYDKMQELLAGAVDDKEPANGSEKLDAGTPAVRSEIRFAELLADAEDGVQSVGPTVQSTVQSSPANAQSQRATEHVRDAPQDTVSPEGTSSSSSSSNPEAVESQIDGGIDDPDSSAQAGGEERRHDDTLSESDKRLVMQWVGKGLEELRRGRTFSGMEDEQLQAHTSFKAAVRTLGLPHPPVYKSALYAASGTLLEGQKHERGMILRVEVVGWLRVHRRAISTWRHNMIAAAFRLTATGARETHLLVVQSLG